MAFTPLCTESCLQLSLMLWGILMRNALGTDCVDRTARDATPEDRALETRVTKASGRKPWSLGARGKKAAEFAECARCLNV